MPIEIISGLYLGNKVDAYNINFITSRHINVIINVTDEVPFLKNVPAECIRIAISDRFAESDSDKNNREYYYQMLQLCKLIDYKLSKNSIILIHCKHGKYRSTALVIAYLMYKTKMNLEEIYKIMMTKYPLGKLRKHIFKQTLQMFEKDMERI